MGVLKNLRYTPPKVQVGAFTPFYILMHIMAIFPGFQDNEPLNWNISEYKAPNWNL